MAVWLGCLGAMLNRRVLYTKRTDTTGKLAKLQRRVNIVFTPLRGTKREEGPHRCVK